MILTSLSLKTIILNTLKLEVRHISDNRKLNECVEESEKEPTDERDECQIPTKVILKNEDLEFVVNSEGTEMPSPQEESKRIDSDTITASQGIKYILIKSELIEDSGIETSEFSEESDMVLAEKESEGLKLNLNTVNDSGERRDNTIKSELGKGHELETSEYSEETETDLIEEELDESILDTVNNCEKRKDIIVKSEMIEELETSEFSQETGVYLDIAVKTEQFEDNELETSVFDEETDNHLCIIKSEPIEGSEYCMLETSEFNKNTDMHFAENNGIDGRGHEFIQENRQVVSLSVGSIPMGQEHVKDHEETGTIETKLLDYTTKQFSCKICNKQFKNKCYLKRHSSTQSKSKYKCDFCKRQFCSLAAYKEHAYFHTGVAPYYCNKCRKSFKLEKSYKSHIKCGHKR